MKRTADRQITKDDAREDEQEEGGGEGEEESGDHYKASAAVMAQRRVVRARRNDDGSWKGKTSDAAAAEAAEAAGAGAKEASGVGGEPSPVPMPSAAAPDSPARANPFAGVQLVAPAAEETTVAAPTKENTDATSNGRHEPPPDGGDSADATPTVGTVDRAAAKGPPGGSAAAVPAPVEPPALAPTEPPKWPAIFGSTSGFSGFGSVAKAGGFSGFATLPAPTGGFGSGAAPAATETTAAAPSADGSTTGSATAAAKSVFGSGGGFSGFATAANSGPSKGFTFGAPAVASKGPGAAETNASNSSSSPPQENAAADQGGDAQSKDPSPTEKPGAQLPTDYELVSGEESEKILLEMRCRTYRWGTQQEVSAAEASKSQQAADAGAKASTLSVPPSASSAFVSSDAQPDAAKESPKGADPSPSSSTGPVSSLSAAAAVDAPPTGKWHEAGIGPLRILLNPTTNGLRLVQRRESTINGPATKVVWNVTLWKESVVKPLGDRHVQVSSFLGTGEPVLILCKCATPTNAADLHSLLQGRVPDLRSAEAAAKSAAAAAVGARASDAAADSVTQPKEVESA